MDGGGLEGAINCPAGPFDSSAWRQFINALRYPLYPPPSSFRVSFLSAPHSLDDDHCVLIIPSAPPSLSFLSHS
jgi:hypothetical protein